MVNLIPLNLSLKGGKLSNPECSYISLGDAVNCVDDCCVVGREEYSRSSYVIKKKKKNLCMVSFTPKLSAALHDFGWCRTAWITAVLTIWGEKWWVSIFTDVKAYIFIFWPDFTLAKVISKKSLGISLLANFSSWGEMCVYRFGCATWDCRYLVTVR